MMNYVTGLILYKSAWTIIESFRLKGTIEDAGTGNDPTTVLNTATYKYQKTWMSVFNF